MLLSSVVIASAQQNNFNTMLKRANELSAAGQYNAALVEAEKLKAAVKRQFGENHTNYAIALGTIANVYRRQSKYTEAERIYQHVLAIFEKTLGPNHLAIAGTLHNLAITFRGQGKYAEAEQFYKRALAIREKVLGASNPAVAKTLMAIGDVYRLQGKYTEAEALHLRAQAIFEQSSGVGQFEMTYNLVGLANVYQSQGKYTKAEELYKRALPVLEKMLGANHPAVADCLLDLAIVYRVQGNYAGAEDLYKRALMIREKTLGTNNPDIAQTLNNIAVNYSAQGKYAEAEGLYQRALVIYETTLGPSHPYVAMTLNNLAAVNGKLGDLRKALEWSRKASQVAIAHDGSEAAAAREIQVADFIKPRTDYFRNQIFYLSAAARRGIEQPLALGREGLEIAQRALRSSAGVAVQQMALRFASGGGALAVLVRERQDLSVAWQIHDKALIGAVTKPEARQDHAGIEAIRRQTADVEARLAVNSSRLEKEFPDYTDLANPKPLKSEEVQKLLGVDEAMVFILTSDKESYIFALTRDGFDWHTIPIGQNALTDKVAAFRRGLDVGELNRSLAAGKPALFDLGLAHELYTTLLGPVEPLIKDKRSLLVVPSGPLTALPFHLLVTEKPAVAQPDVKDIVAYRDAAWLLKSHAVTVLPSVASLKALRVFGRKNEASKPFIGFGDPVFKDETAPAGGQRIVLKVKTAGKTRAYSDYWRGAGVDRAKLADALPPLEDTADELKAVAAELGAPASDIYIGKAASETTVKHAPLANYRVVYFATHGLVAGDVRGLGEPALALSIPKNPTPFDDGLLTASEVAQLKLNADWVVLSACNTAAGDRPGAEALSGLARSFFYAGARALLVSHWTVDSNAAARLTTSTFAILKDNPTIGRTEALRRAMLAYMNDTANPRNAYPAFWGPFSIVGEGAVQ
jgi:CHAT domain-containing protein/Tfp pilus assembly protein PilF